MVSLKDYKEKRGITDEQLANARHETHTYFHSYNLREARKAENMTQVELAKKIGVSQNRVSRMENGDINAMSLDALRRYIEALGGKVTLVADLPTGKVSIV